MNNDPTKHPATGGHKNQSPRFVRTAGLRKKRTLAEFMLDSDIKPVMLVGKCAQYFGWGAVAGFFLGGFCVYAYAIFKPLPYSRVANEPAQTTVIVPHQAKAVQLHGFVRDRMGKPMNERFWVGVLAKQLGPVQSSDGSFALEVPQSNTYDMALWTTEAITIYNGFAAEQDGNGYRLQQALPFLPAVRTPAVEASRSETSRLAATSRSIANRRTARNPSG